MLSQAAVFALVQQLGGSNNNIIYNAKFIDFCGGCHYSALLLAQLLYWSDKTRLEGGWIAKTKEEWYNELRLSPYKMRLAEAKLRDELGILETDVFKFRGFPTNHYRFRQEAFVAAFVKFFEHGYSKDLSNGVSENSLQSLVKSFEEPYTDTTKQIVLSDTTSKISGTGKPGRGKQKSDAADSSTTEAPQTRPGRKKSDVSICPVFKPAQKAFEEEYLKRTGNKYAFNGGKDGNSLKWILEQLIKIQEGQTWDDALNLFIAIIQGWESMPVWMRPNSNFNISFIRSQYNGIIAAISDKIKGVGNNAISGSEW